MFFTSLLRQSLVFSRLSGTALFGALLRGRSKRLRRRSRHPAKVEDRYETIHAAAEVLEDRTLLSMITVNSLADDVDAGDGELTLREGIMIANDSSGATSFDGVSSTDVADTIVFDDSVFDGGDTIVLGAQLPTITEELTIDGSIEAGAFRVIVDGDDSSRILDVDTGVPVDLQNLTLQNGDSGGSNGGAISNDGTLTIADSTLFSNSAEDGGGVFNTGALSIVDGTLIGNSAGDDGGGIFNDGGTVTISGSTLIGNSADDDGGGIENNGGTVTITGSTLSGNSAKDGGGIFNSNGTDGTLSITGSTLSGNSAGDDGGGIFNRATLIIENSTLIGNSTDDDGGAIVNNGGTSTITNSTLAGNSADDDGGGVFNDGGTVTINSATLSGNSAEEGGGIFNFDGTVALENDTLSGNSANGDGGGVYNLATVTTANGTLTDNAAGDDGGGIWNNSGGTVQADNTIIAGNTAASEGPDVYGELTSDDFNLIGDTFGFSFDGGAGANDLLLVDPLLGPLQDNGGPTETHALLPGSPALNAGNSTLTSDQRGFPRPLGTAPDVGSYEANFPDGFVDADNTDNEIIVRRREDNSDQVEVVVDGEVVFVEALASLESLTINGLGGNDTLTVDSSNGLLLLPDGTRFDGGAGFDRLVLQQTGDPMRDSSFIDIGAGAGSGQSVITDGLDVQTVSFQNIEPISDNVAAATFRIGSVPGIASLLQDDNQINYEASPLFGPTWGRVTVDNFEPIDFINKQELVIDAGAGSDTINLNNPVSPAGLTGITVSGGDPTGGSDTVVVNGTTGADSIGVSYDLSPTPPSSTTTTPANDEARVTGAQPVPVEVDAAERLVINGRLGDDSLTLTTPDGSNRVTYTPGDAADAAEILTDNLLPISFVSLGSGGSVTLDDPADGRVDTLAYNGSAFGDVFDVAATSGAISSTNPSRTALTVSTPGVSDLRLNGLAGDDTFNVNAPQPYDSVLVDGGEPDASDVLNLLGTDEADDAIVNFYDPANLPLVQGVPVQNRIFGFGATVGLAGVEDVHLDTDGNDDTLTVNGTFVDDVLTYTPTGQEAGVFSAEGFNTTFAFENVNDTFRVSGRSAGADEVVVRGTNNHDLIIVDAPARTVTVQNASGTDLKPVVLDDDVEVATAQGRLGNDTILVVPEAGVGAVPLSNLLIHADGGPPGASDALVVAADAAGTPLDNDTHFVVVNRSRTPDEGVVRVFRDTAGAGNPPTQLPDIVYSDAEIVEPLLKLTDPATDEPNLLILGPDVFEQNQTRQTAAFVGSGATLNVTDLAIFPNATEHPFVPADQDWFRYVAAETGSLDFQVFFEQYDPDLLPAGGDLTIEIYDVDGDLIGTSATADDNERVTVPVIRNETYYLRVIGAENVGINGYDMTVVNVPAPVPQLVDLIAETDSGRSDTDDVTNFDADVNDPAQFDIILDDDRVDEFLNIDMMPDTNADDAFTDGFDYVVEVFNNGVSIGFAHFTGGNTWRFVATEGDLNEGHNNFISAAVRFRDPADPPVEGRGELSDPLQVTLDTIAPPVTITDIDPAASDTGVIDQPELFVDRITSDTATGFFGRAEADAIVRLYVDPSDDGSVEFPDEFALDVADPLDGDEAFPDGQWRQAFIHDLNDPNFFPQDGLREVLVEAEDLAGNVNTVDDGNGDEDQTINIFIDTRGPQVDDVHISEAPEFDLFDPKPSSGPTPLVDSLDIDFIDQPVRIGEQLVIGDEPDVVFVIDVSGSTGGGFAGGSVGDLNGDNNADTILDAEIAGFIALNQDLISRGLGSTAEVGIVSFSSGATQLDMDPIAPGVQLVTTPSADVDGNGTPDVQDVLASLNSGGGTNFEAPLQSAINTFTTLGTASGDGNLIFLSDGFGGGNFADEVTTLQGLGVNLRAFGVGTGSSLTQLQQIDPMAVQFTTTNELLAVFSGAGGGGGAGGADGAFIYPAVNEILATTPGNYRLEGEHNGIIPIESIEFIDNTEADDIGRTTVRLNFFNPLPDDRYTLTIFDRIQDDAGNALDGESNAEEPLEDPDFPSGDGVPGESFAARFTVDSRPEIGFWSQAGIFVDANGNLTMETPVGNNVTGDAVPINTDLQFLLGSGRHPVAQTDEIFAGQFTANGAAVNDGFDRLGAYGLFGGVFRFLLDTDNDGVGDLWRATTLQINGVPVAGDFAPGRPGEEIGVFDGTRWYLDTNGNNDIDPGDAVIASPIRGLPIVGDFDGDGNFDLGAHRASTNTFQFDLSHNGFGQLDATIAFGFPGVLERPFAADFNQDGVTDVGLTTPDQDGVGGPLEWYILLSQGNPVTGTVNTLNHGFSPQPLGGDLFTEFGQSTVIPVVGNFDPPIDNGLAGNDDSVPPALASIAATVSGDFNGDGNDDVAVILNGDGRVYVGLSNGSEFVAAPDIVWADLGDPADFVDILVGDFNNDGRDDIAAFAADGVWHVGLSTGGDFNFGEWVQWSAASAWSEFLIGDFDGDGRDDIAGFAHNGRWWIGRSTGSGLSTSLWTHWSGSSAWAKMVVGDFNGDGRDDIAGFAHNGRWWVGQSTGSRFYTSLWTQWSDSSAWAELLVGDFDGDGRDDIAGFAHNGRWWVGRSTGGRFHTSLWSQWSSSSAWTQFAVGDFDGDGRDDVAGVAHNGTVWHGASQGDRFDTHLWSERPEDELEWPVALTPDVDGDGDEELFGFWSSPETQDDLFSRLQQLAPVL